MSEVQGTLDKDWQRGTSFPLVYNVTTGWRIVMMVLAAFFAACGIGIGVMTTQRQLDMVGTLVLMAFVSIPLGMAVYSICYAFGARVTLERDAIEIRKPFGSRRLSRAQIRGRRFVQSRNTTAYKLIVPISGRVLMVDTSSFGLDDRFYAWFNALPDLDQAAQDETLAEVKNDPSLGNSPQERLDSLKKAQQLGRAIAFAPLLLLMWVMVMPRPYGLAVACAALLPWLGVALVWAKPGLFKFDGKQGDVRPNVSVLLMTPPMALALRAVLDVTVVDLGPLFLWGFVASLPLLVAVLLAPRAETVKGKRWVLPLLLLPFTTAYGVGLLAIVDTTWDVAQPQIFQTTVTGKDVSRGKSTTYYLHLARWSQTIDKDRIAVPRAYYQAVGRGDTVCVRLHPGKFGVRWVQLGGCG